MNRKKALQAATKALAILEQAGLVPEPRSMNDFTTPEGIIRAGADTMAAGVNKLRREVEAS